MNIFSRLFKKEIKYKYVVKCETYEVDFRVEPYGSEHYVEEFEVGRYKLKSLAICGIKKHILAICDSEVGDLTEGNEGYEENLNLGILYRVDENIFEWRFPPEDKLENIIKYTIEEI